MRKQYFSKLFPQKCISFNQISSVRNYLNIQFWTNFYLFLYVIMIIIMMKLLFYLFLVILFWTRCLTFVHVSAGVLSESFPQCLTSKTALDCPSSFIIFFKFAFSLFISLQFAFEPIDESPSPRVLKTNQRLFVKLRRF